MTGSLTVKVDYLTNKTASNSTPVALILTNRPYRYAAVGVLARDIRIRIFEGSIVDTFTQTLG